MKTAISINENGTQVRLVAENEFERSLIEFLDADYSATIHIERDGDDVHYYAVHRDNKPKAAVFTLTRNPEKPSSTNA